VSDISASVGSHSITPGLSSTGPVSSNGTINWNVFVVLVAVRVSGSHGVESIFDSVGGLSGPESAEIVWCEGVAFAINEGGMVTNAVGSIHSNIFASISVGSDTSTSGVVSGAGLEFGLSVPEGDVVIGC